MSGNILCKEFDPSWVTTMWCLQNAEQNTVYVWPTRHITKYTLPDGHHSKSDVLGGHIIGTLDFVDFISFSHDNTVVLQHYCV